MLRKIATIKEFSLTPWLFMAFFLLLISFIHEAWSQTEGDITYADLAPIFEQRCVMCHAGDSAPVGLRLNSFDAILKGSERGAVVKAGEPSASELILRINGISQPRMPMTGPPYLSKTQIMMFERWVTAGMPRGDSDRSDPVKSEPPQPESNEFITYLDVAPIFARRCVKCHTDNGLMGAAPEGYRLTSYAATLSASERVRVVPGNALASALVRRIQGYARPRMPFDGPPYLSNAEIRLIEEWIDQGARDVDGNPASVPTGATIRLHGTLDAYWQLDGLNLNVSSGTRIDKSPAPGDYVEVRGRLGDDGKIEVKRLRRR